jgi:uncharacterized protein YggU (UPF0235/DUF167 family)
LPSRYLVIAPESDHEELVEFISENAAFPTKNVQLIDGHWGLEKTIARIAGFKPADL